MHDDLHVVGTACSIPRARRSSSEAQARLAARRQSPAVQPFASPALSCPSVALPAHESPSASARRPRGFAAPPPARHPESPAALDRGLRVRNDLRAPPSSPRARPRAPLLRRSAACCWRRARLVGAAVPTSSSISAVPATRACATRPSGRRARRSASPRRRTAQGPRRSRPRSSADRRARASMPRAAARATGKRGSPAPRRRAARGGAVRAAPRARRSGEPARRPRGPVPPVASRAPRSAAAPSRSGAGSTTDRIACAEMARMTPATASSSVLGFEAGCVTSPIATAASAAFRASVPHPAGAE